MQANLFFSKIHFAALVIASILLISLFSLEAQTPPSHYVGEIYGGGIVVRTPNGKTRGLIAGLYDLEYNGSYYFTWAPENVKNSVVFPVGTKGNGQEYTDIITKKYGNLVCPADMCKRFVETMDGQTYDDWFLPSQYELMYFVYLRDVVNFALDYDGNPLSFGLKNHKGYVEQMDPFGCHQNSYWTSEEKSKFRTYTGLYGRPPFWKDGKYNEGGHSQPFESLKGCRLKVRPFRFFTQ